MISILMPVYNGIEFMEESVGSVLNQTYTSWDLIIGVNGHPENSAVYKQALQYKSKSIKVLDLHHIKGKSNALNEMIKYCSYDHVALLDVDDIWHPHKLDFQAPLMLEYDVIGTRCIYFGDRDGIIPSIPVGNITQKDFLIANPIINSSAIIR